MKNGEGLNPLHYAVYGGRKEIAELLIAEDADVSLKNKFKSTALHYAAWRGHNEISELLIAKGANVNSFTISIVKTPLDWAMRGEHIETAELLRKHGAKTGEELKTEGN